LDIRSEKANAFDAEDQRVLKTLANQITIAIHNASLYEMEKELHHLEEEKTKTLTRLNADKDKFFSIISHDLRGPFNTVLGNAQLLANKVDTWPKEEIHDVTEDIYKGAKSAYNLLDNLLTWSRMQREDGMKVTPEPIALRELLLEAITILKPTATQKEIELNLTLKDEIWVRADRYMLETVVRNLIGNAMKFTPRRGKVTLAACQGGQNGDPGYATLRVQDTGIGISVENLKKLFRIDTQLTTKGTEKETGSGLGLLICKEMVERNGGQIWVESEPDKGTTMTFTLPMITSPTS
jgi:two-component system sensor histidine kinase/response regulator